jgi:probable F420-dependent oxidoreductase
MGAQHDDVRRALGPVGAWTFAFDSMGAEAIRTAARRIEALGYGALWVPEGSASREVFSHLSLLLGATDRITVASGIANITARHPTSMAQGARTVAGASPGRVVIGIGVGHQYSTAQRGIDWTDPVGRMRTYLEEMDATPWYAPPVSAPRILAALGPKMIDLSDEMALGAHTYFVPVEHTAWARERLGPEPLLAVEMTAVAEAEPTAARAKARAWARHYLELPNYANNWRRMGFAETDVAGAGTDRLIDAAVAWGDAEATAARVHEHLAAGADHVCVQFVGGTDDDPALGALDALASRLIGDRARPPRDVRTPS